MLGMNVPPNWSAVSQESINHSNGNKDVSGDVKRQMGDIDILIQTAIRECSPTSPSKETCPEVSACQDCALEAMLTCEQPQANGCVQRRLTFLRQPLRTRISPH